MRRHNPNGASTRVLGPPAARQRGEGGRNPVAEKTVEESGCREDSGGILLPRRQWRQARPPDETDSTTRKKRAQRRRERTRAQGLEGDDESNGWAPTTKEPKDESQAQSMKQVPIHASARRGRAEGGAEAEEAEEAEGRAASTAYGASTCTRECASRTSRRKPKETKETQNHTTQWPIVFVPEGQWRGRGGPPDRGRWGQRVLRGQRVSRGISRLRRQRRPFFFTRNGVFWDACWSWLGARPRTALWQTGGNGTHAVRSAVGRAVGRA